MLNFIPLQEQIALNDFSLITTQLKALADPVRLQIIDMLSCMDLCACSLLEGLSITQPTLSHHMKILINSQLVTSSKRGTWVYYSINHEQIDHLFSMIDNLRKPKINCSCYQHSCACTPEHKQTKQEQIMEIHI